GRTAARVARRQTSDATAGRRSGGRRMVRLHARRPDPTQPGAGASSDGVPTGGPDLTGPTSPPHRVGRPGGGEQPVSNSPPHPVGRSARTAKRSRPGGGEQNRSLTRVAVLTGWVGSRVRIDD